MQARAVRSMPQRVCQTIPLRSRSDHGRVARSVPATVPEDAGHAGTARRGNASMGSATAGVTGQDRKPQLDFALIGHEESWRAASDVLAVLRGPERARLPDDEIRE